MLHHSTQVQNFSKKPESFLVPNYGKSHPCSSPPSRSQQVLLSIQCKLRPPNEYTGSASVSTSTRAQVDRRGRYEMPLPECKCLYQHDWHGRIQAGLPNTREEALVLCVNGVSLWYEKSRNSKCNLCCHLKGPSKKSMEYSKVSVLLKLNIQIIPIRRLICKNT